MLGSLKLQIGSDAFSAQYQQMPVPPGGAMIKRNWIERYTDLPPQHERFLILQSWDTASKGGPENDCSVCTTWIVTRNRRWYLVDVWRRRVDYPDAESGRADPAPGIRRDAFSSRTPAPGLRSFKSCEARSPALSR